MDQPLSVFTPTLGWRLRVASARVHQQLGSAGVVGLLVLMLAAAKGYAAWADQVAHQRALQTTVAEPTSVAVPALPAASTPRMRWPAAADVPTLLARMERTAVEQGLGWPQADYRITAAGELPAALEVRCALKGAYPSIRRFVTALLLDQPTLTLREFSLSRANADASQVDAKLVLVVYLAGDSVEAAR